MSLESLLHLCAPHVLIPKVHLQLCKGGERFGAQAIAKLCEDLAKDAEKTFA